MTLTRLCAVFTGILTMSVWTNASAAQAPALAEITPEAKELLARVAAAYREHKAYADQGEVTVSVTAKGRVTRKVQKVPLLFVRPNQFAVNFGPLAVFSDGGQLVVVDYVHRNIYERRITGAGLTTDFSSLNEDERKSNEQLLYYRDKILAPGPKTESDQTLGVVGAQMVGVVLTLLIDPEPIKSLRQGASQIDIEVGPGMTENLRIRYAHGPDLRLFLDPDSKLVKQIELAFSPAQQQAVSPAGLDVKELRIEWRAGKITHDEKQVLNDLAKLRPGLQKAPLANFSRTTEMAVPLQIRAAIPLPPGGTSLVERIRNLVHSLLG